MSDLYDEVLGWLESYDAMRRKVEMLQYELWGFEGICADEMIEGIALGARLGGGGFSRGHPSDKTMAIALHYTGQIARMEGEARSEIANELRRARIKVERLELYVSLLRGRERKVVRMLYFEGKSFADAEGELGLSQRTLSSCRKSAINQLASMYSLVKNIGATGT